MKCPKCGTELVWMGNVQIVIRDTDKYYHRLSKKAFQSKDIELWGVDWERGELFCPNYLSCGYHPALFRAKKRGKKWLKSKKNQKETGTSTKPTG